MTETMEIRKFVEGDEQDIIKLLDITFGEGNTEEKWKWTYKENADGFFPELIWLAYYSGELAGHYAIIPARMKIGNEFLLGSQSVGTATHPGHRRKGIFEKLAKNTYSNAIKNGIPLTYGFTKVGPSYYGFIKKLNWHHICFLIENEMVVNPQEALKRHFKGKLPAFLIPPIASFITLRNKRKLKTKMREDILIREITKFDDRISVLWKIIAKNYDIMIVKDKKFFEWRLKSPGHNYSIFIAEKGDKLLGYMIFSEGKNDGRIADIMVHPEHEEIIPSLVLEAVSICKYRGKDMLRCVLPRDHRYITVLRKMGFLSTETKMSFIVRLNEPNEELEERIRNIKSWYITDLDSDHV